MRFVAAILLVISGALPLAAQREFLTNDEIEKIREAQDPNLRLKLYVVFARQRIDQLQQQIAKDKKGRSVVVRELLQDYSQIIDAIDTVSDDALKRKVDIALGIAAVSEAEKKIIPILQKIEDSAPHDLDLYDLELKDAIGNTSDSLEATKQDLGQRSTIVAEKAAEEKKKVESLTSVQERKEQKAETAKAHPDMGDDGQPKRKPPTLYKPGEAAQPSDITKQPNQP
jgi:nucleotide-binding universal stress UspA family protein